MMIARAHVPTCVVGIAGLLTACAIPTTQLGTVSADALRAEQLKQQQLAIEWDLRQQQRVEDVGHALLAAATPFCSGALAPRAGIRFANVHSFARDYQPAARSLGFSDTLVVVGVARGSAAQRAGFAAGDRVVSLNGGSPPLGSSAVQALARVLAARRAAPVNLTLQQGDTRFLSDTAPSPDIPAPSGVLVTAVPADTVCGYNLIAAREDALNAWADGTNVTVTSGMLRFVADDDELAAVLAHEIAHNAMRHVQAQQKNAALGGVFGAILDIAAATQGVNTQGEFTKAGVNVGSIVFSQDFEREADYVGLYLLARAGRPTANAPNLWRRMAQENPGSIKYASTHPTTAERFVRLDQASAEIEQKIARGDDLRPEMRGALAAAGRTTTQAPAAPTRTVTSKGEVAAPQRTPKVEHGLTPEKSVTTSALSPRRDSPMSREPIARVAPTYSTTVFTYDSVSYTFGPPAPRNGLGVAQVRRRALQAYQDGNEALELRLYEQAEERYREAVLYDGGEARYHAALGALLLKRGKLAAAEAALSAAVLLDVENPVYRQLLLEVRRRP